MAGTLTIAGMSSGDSGGQRTFGPNSIVGSTIVNETWSGPLASGDNTISVPLGSVAVWVLPPPNSSATLTFRTNLNSTDGGLNLNGANGWFAYQFPATAPTSIILKSGAAVSSFATAIFI